jgi:serine/threonine protein kinase
MEKFPNFGPNYEILEELGRGSSGIVFKARHKQSGRLVAIKTITPKSPKDWPTQCRRFMREAQVIAGCNHPNIVQAYEIGQHAGQPYIGREFVEGATLQQHMEERALSGREAAKVVELITWPLEYVHRLGLIHRNLSPENVLITADGTVKLIGFGNARAMGGCPPIFIDIDIQALGTMLFVLMTRKYWFPEGLSLLPEELASICMKCCNAEPENQYHSAMELAEDLRRYLRNA